MCGIAGRVNHLSGMPVDPAEVGIMCDFIAHRGPDGAGVWCEGAVGFGHRRLAIIDLSPAGRQPMSTADGRVTITFNGEIYNFLELRDRLAARGHHFRSRSDTEVILAAWREYGTACVTHLRGMFAFALWDADQQTCFIARDRLGKKPLHYRIDADGLVFASEPKAFFASPAFTAQPNLPAISEYLTWQYVPSPRSAFDGVRQLPAAHSLLVRDGRVTIERYWDLSYEPKGPTGEAEAADGLLERLREAVRLRMISDVPLGAFLSGGIDSSLVVALMAEVGSGAVKTFSIGFDEAQYNELPYARLVAERFGTDHHELVVRPDALSILPTLAWHYDEPFADESAIPTYYVSQMTRRHVTVALNGDGGDESFAGYRRYLPSRTDAVAGRIPTDVRDGLARLLRRLPMRDHASIRYAQEVFASPERRHAHRLMHFKPWMKARLCTPAFAAAAATGDEAQYMLEAFARSDGRAFLDRALHADIATYLADGLLVKVDIAAMANSLEGRSPLLDHEVMEFAARLPVTMKLQGHDRKRLLRSVARRLLPAELFDHPKTGFGVPLDAWFRKELRPLAEDLLLDGRLARRGYFDMAFVAGMVREHGDGTRQWHDQLWNLVMLESWHRTFVDARPARPAATSLDHATAGPRID